METRRTTRASASSARDVMARGMPEKVIHFWNHHGMIVFVSFYNVTCSTILHNSGCQMKEVDGVSHKAKPKKVTSGQKASHLLNLGTIACIASGLFIRICCNLAS